MLQTQYEHGRVNGDVMKFAADTTLVAQENYQAGRKLAPKVEFHDTGRTIKKLETTFLHGPLVVKTPDSFDACTLAAFETRGIDERHGPFTAWHKNGQLSKQGEFRYNLPVGKIDSWFENGQRQMEGLYVDGRQEGVWTWWHGNGQKAIAGEYHDGNAVGKWTWWQPTGKVAQRADMSDRPLPLRRRPPKPTPNRAKRSYSNCSCSNQLTCPGGRPPRPRRPLAGGAADCGRDVPSGIIAAANELRTFHLAGNAWLVPRWNTPTAIAATPRGSSDPRDRDWRLRHFVERRKTRISSRAASRSRAWRRDSCRR